MDYDDLLDFMNSTDEVPESERRYPIPPVPPQWNTIERPPAGLIGYSWSHIPLTVVSAALHGSMCRGRVEESIQWALELCWVGPHSMKNTVKTLLKFAAHDVGPADPQAFWVVLQLCGKVTGTNPRDPNELLSIASSIEYLCKCKKTRIVHLALLNSEMENIPTLATNVAEIPEQIYLMLCDAINALDLHECIRLAECLYHSKGKVARNFNGTKTSPKWLIWKAIEECINTVYTSNLCQIVCMNQWPMNALGRVLYAHVFCTLCCTDFDQSALPDHLSPNMNLADVIETCWNRKELYGIPDYAYDRYTNEGQKKKRGFVHHLTEVCVLSNEDERWKEETEESMSTVITWYELTGGDKEHSKKKL